MALTDTELRVKVTEWLEELKSLGSPDAIATHFESIGIKGKTGESSACPVAVYVNNKLAELVMTGDVPADSHATVGATWVTVYNPDNSYACYDVELPAVVVTFVINFDGREYPNLIED